MAVEDTWHRKDGTRSRAYGRGRRWRVRWRGHPSRSFVSKRRAEDYERQLRNLDETVRPNDPATVGVLVARWLATKADLSESGRRNCRLSADEVTRRWGRVLVTDVTAPDVREWLAAMPGSASRRIKRLQALSGAIRVGIDLEMVAANPCDQVAHPRERAREARYLTPAEVQAIAEAGDDQHRAIVWLLATTGLRIGEAFALDVADVNSRRRRLRVRAVEVGASKSDARDVPISAPVLALLDLDRPGTAPLFVGAKGGRLDPHHWRPRHFYPAVNAAGLAGVRPHDLRHTAVSLAAASGAPIDVVGRMVGHRPGSRVTGARYRHLFDDELDRLADRLDSLVRGESVANGLHPPA